MTANRGHVLDAGATPEEEAEAREKLYAEYRETAPRIGVSLSRRVDPAEGYA